jgi:hypothetical protein
LTTLELFRVTTTVLLLSNHLKTLHETAMGEGLAMVGNLKDCFSKAHSLIRDYR